MPITQSIYTPPTTFSYIDRAFDYEVVAESQSNQILGDVGSPGDYLHKIVFGIVAPTNGIILKGGTVPVLNIVNATITGLYELAIGLKAQTQWKITTGAGTNVLAIGVFT